MKDLLTALGFLTVLPVPQTAAENREMAGAPRWFMVVGLLIGCLLAPLALALYTLLPAGPAAVLVVAALLAVSGGLHLDGLVDSADGLCSVRERQRMLAIMRDSRIGAMGAIALVMVLALKMACLAELHAGQAAVAVFLAPAAGRLAMLACMVILPYARPEGGLATLFYPGASLLVLGSNGMVFCLLCLLLLGPGSGLPLLLSVAVTLLFVRLCRGRLGGATGDTLGAACELGEAAFLCGLLLLWS